MSFSYSCAQSSSSIKRLRFVYNYAHRILHCIPRSVIVGQGRRGAGAWQGHCPCLSKIGATETEVPFRNSIIGNFVVYQGRLETIFAAIRAPRKFTMAFYNICYHFWGQHCYWIETSVLVTSFCFYKFPLPSSLWLNPCPIAAPASLVFSHSKPTTVFRQYIWCLD